MKLYLLTRLHTVGWDEVVSLVIRAENEEQATQIANTNTGNEGEIWDDPLQVSCEVLENEGDVGIIIDDYKAS